MCVRACVRACVCFADECTTMCGYPRVIMEGSEHDWMLLRQHAEQLINGRCEARFAAKWCGALLPLLDKLLAEYGKGRRGQAATADGVFWNAMIKRGGVKGSGGRSWFTGWINILFPYIKQAPNMYMVPYSASNGYVKEGRPGKFYVPTRKGQNMFRQLLMSNSNSLPSGDRSYGGPSPNQFPHGLSEAPVTWNYLGEKEQLTFNSGFLGATQDTDTGVVRPLVGWYITRAEQSAGDDDDHASSI